MKLNKIALATMTAVTLMGVSLQSNAQLAFSVNPNAAWFGYINAFNLDNTYATGFPDATADLRASFAAGPATPLTLSPNTRLYDTVLSEPFWVDQITFAPNKIIEANIYQEVSSVPIGTTVTFDFSTIANTLPSGYEARGFIKVLDGFATWATTQYQYVNLVAGQSASVSFVVADAGAGSELVQAGFSLKGLAVTGSSAEALTSVQVVPEPTTMALAGLGAAALLTLRRRS
jgi:hypothetical protein